MKLYAIIRAFRRWSRGFSISSSRWLFNIGTSGWWSVTTVKCASPAKNTLHFMIAHDTARSSSSMTAYLDSASVRKRDPAWVRVQVLSTFCCCRMKPRPFLLASVQRRVGRLQSKNERVGAVVNDSLATWNAWSRFGDQRKSFFVLRRGRSGARSVAMESVLAESWFANPKKGTKVSAVGGSWESGYCLCDCLVNLVTFL